MCIAHVPQTYSLICAGEPREDPTDEGEDSENQARSENVLALGRTLVYLDCNDQI